MKTIITYDMLKDLGKNICAIYEFFHPNGLSVEELLEKAEEHNYYRGIYQYLYDVGVIK